MEESMRKRKFLFFTFLLLLFCLAGFNLFYNLGTMNIYSWDEARHGVSAYEMIHNKNYVVNTYRYRNDYWNLKPVLSFWMITIGYKTAGFNALGLRLYSAVLALLTIVMVAVFTFRKYGKIASLVSVLSLLTSIQYVTNHSSRTGDADSLFVFLFTAAMLSLLSSKQNVKWLYISGAAFSLAFLTKSWHAGNIAIIIFLYLFLTGQYKKLSLVNWLLLFLCMAIPIGLWGIYRYQYDGTDFFWKMFMVDLLHRSTTTIEGHVGGIDFYAYILIHFFAYWLIILLGVFVFSIKKGISFKSAFFDKKNEWVGLLLWIFVPFVLFSLASTKVRWYILPVYPPLCIIIGALSGKLWSKRNNLIKFILAASLLVVSGVYEKPIFIYLTHPVPDFQQNLLHQVQGRKDISGSNIYLYNPALPYWTQAMVLTVELADDFKATDGGVAGFLKDPHGVLLVNKKMVTEAFLNKYSLKVVSSNLWGSIVSKKTKS